MTELDITAEQLAEFLRQAKLATFAGDGHRSRADYLRMYNYQSEEWRYEDKYFGNLIDTGMEVVFWSKFPIWAMVYRGGVFSSYQERSREVFSFLKEALREIPDIIPVRGPSQFSRSDLIYKNIVHGRLDNFWGTEEISEGGVQVYWRRYHGGLIGDRDYSLWGSLR